jgi:hypothetical protein
MKSYQNQRPKDAKDLVYPVSFMIYVVFKNKGIAVDEMKLESRWDFFVS